MTYRVLKNKYGYYKILKLVDFKIFKIWITYNGFNNIWLNLISNKKFFKSIEEVNYELESIKNMEELHRQKTHDSFELEREIV